MTGLEIIEQIPIMELPSLITIGFIFGTFSIFVPMCIVHKLTNDFDKLLLTEFISGIIYVVFVLTMLISGVCEKPTGEYQYKVRIGEEVSYVEFTDKYDVITENNDGTYIIQERNIC